MIQAGRPGRHRTRLNTEHAIPHQSGYYAGAEGQFLVPANGLHRSASVSAQRPQVNIYNDNVPHWDAPSGYRPRSVHGVLYDNDYEDIVYERRRSGSKVRSSPQREFDEETKGKLKSYEDLKRKQEESEQRERIKEKLRVDQLKADAERADREKHDKELREQAIEEYKIKEEEEKIKKKQQQEKEDEEFKERMRKTLWANGYSSDQIERMMKRAEKKDLEGGDSRSRALALNRPTYIKVHRKHLDPETLDVYRLPWELDDVS